MAGRKPIRRKLEPGIYERVDDNGERLGLEIVYKDQAGKTRRRTVKGGGLPKARDELAAARTRRTRRETEPLNPRTTFNEVADLFERVHLASLRPNTQDTYRPALRDLRKAFGQRRISSITKADLRAFVNDLRKTEKRNGKTLKANTIQTRLTVLGAIYSFARDDLNMPIIKPRLKPSEQPNPADDVREHRVLNAEELQKILDMPIIKPRLKPSEQPNPADDVREHRVLNAEELQKVLDASPPAARLYFDTLAQTGCRRGEGLGIRPRDVGNGEIRFREQHSRNGIGPLKTTQSKRTIEITRGLEAELKLISGPERVFQHLNYSTLGDQWNAALKAAGLADPQPVIHDLRHTHASRLIAAGWDPVEIARRLGDRVETVLRVYVHEFDKRRRSEFRRESLEGLYNPGMATQTPPQTTTTNPVDQTEIADLQARRDRR